MFKDTLWSLREFLPGKPTVALKMSKELSGEHELRWRLPTWYQEATEKGGGALQK